MYNVLYTVSFTLCIAMLLYGIIRLCVAGFRREPGALRHALWLPGSMFAFLFCMAVVTWLVP